MSSWRLCKHFDLTEVRAQSRYKVRSYELVNPTFKISLLKFSSIRIIRTIRKNLLIRIIWIFGQRITSCAVQPVPWKMRLEKLKEMQILRSKSWEILVNCKFKLNKNPNLNLYRVIPRNSNPIKISIPLCIVRYREIWFIRFWLVDYNPSTIQDFDWHFFHHFEFHLPGNGL